MVLVLPRLMAPGTVNPPAVLAFSVTAEFCSMVLVTPALAMPRVPLPVIGPPASPAPLPTLVTVPVPALAQAHAVPFHCSTWLVAQVFSRPSASVPLVPPPVSPLPVAVVTPVSVPSPVPGNVCPVANVISPLLAMCNPVCAGAPVPSANSRFRVPEGVAVSLSAGWASQKKV